MTRRRPSADLFTHCWQVLETQLTPPERAYADQWAATVRDRFDRDDVNLADPEVARIVVVTVLLARELQHLMGDGWGGLAVLDCPQCFFAGMIGAVTKALHG